MYPPSAITVSACVSGIVAHSSVHAFWLLYYVLLFTKSIYLLFGQFTWIVLATIPWVMGEGQLIITVIIMLAAITAIIIVIKQIYGGPFGVNPGDVIWTVAGHSYGG